MSSVVLAFSISSQVEKYGALAGFAGIIGIAILSLLFFAQAREVKRLREWAGRAPERAAELERLATEAAVRAARPVPVPAVRTVAPVSRIVPPASAPVVPGAQPAAPGVGAAAGAVAAAGVEAPAAPSPGPATAPALEPTGAPADSPDQAAPAAEGAEAAEAEPAAATPAAVDATAVEGGSVAVPSADDPAAAEAEPAEAEPAEAQADAAGEAAPDTGDAPDLPGADTPAALDDEPVASPIAAEGALAPVPDYAEAGEGDLPELVAPEVEPVPHAAQELAPAPATAAAAARMSAGSRTTLPAPPIGVGASAGAANGGPAPGDDAPRRIPPHPSPAYGAPRGGDENFEARRAASAAVRLEQLGTRSRRPSRRVVLFGVVALVAVIALVVVIATSGSSSPSRSPTAATSTSVNVSHPAAPRAVATNPSTLGVIVVNGSGVFDLAHHLASDLNTNGYNKATFTDAHPNGTVTTSVVYYGTGYKAAAQDVAQVLGISSVQAMNATTQNLTPGTPIVVVAGTDQASAVSGGGSTATTSGQ